MEQGADAVGPGEAIQGGFQEEDVFEPRAARTFVFVSSLPERGSGRPNGLSSLACSDSPSMPDTPVLSTPCPALFSP